MAQPVNKIMTETELDKSDYRQRFVEVSTSPNDFVTGDATLLLSTIPFLPPGDSFTDIPLYPVGLTQSFQVNEGINGQFLPEVGSSRKVNTAGTASGSGSISRLEYHGNSLTAALYRPTFYFMAACDELSGLADKLMAQSANTDWIKSLCAPGLDMYSLGITESIDRVIADGGMNGLLYKLPFGLVEVKRDPKQRVVKINYYEQCALRGQNDGSSAGQFQVADNLSFEFERKRPLVTAGIFSLSLGSTEGVLSRTP